jgi:ATP-dependent DNA ligase
MAFVILVPPFIAPMLCQRITDQRRLADRGYVAEPKLDGQRAQLHAQAGRATACYGRRGLRLRDSPRS